MFSMNFAIKRKLLLKKTTNRQMFSIPLKISSFFLIFFEPNRANRIFMSSIECDFKYNIYYVNSRFFQKTNTDQDK
jgi:hypothetical protein